MSTGGSAAASGERHPASTASTGNTRQGPFSRGINTASTNSEPLENDVFGNSSEKATPSRAPTAPAKTAGKLPPQYTRIRAARYSGFRATWISGISSLRREHAPGFPEGLGYFDIDDDNRHLACQNVHNSSDRVNACLSINPASLECLACTLRFCRTSRPAS